MSEYGLCFVFIAALLKKNISRNIFFIQLLSNADYVKWHLGEIINRVNNWNVNIRSALFYDSVRKTNFCGVIVVALGNIFFFPG